MGYLRGLLLGCACQLAWTQGVKDGPALPSQQPAWLQDLIQFRQTQRASVHYNGSVYDNYLLWSSSMLIAPQSHIYDRFLFDNKAGIWTVDRFLDDLIDRYGGVDGVLLWATYPNMGVDERSQFDLMYDLPGGIEGLAAAIARFHERGVRAGLPYNPWDTGTNRSGLSDPDALASVAAAVKADFANGDTMGDMGLSFWAASVAAGNPLAFQPEGGGSIASLQWVKTGWGEGWPAPFIPNVDVERWTETRHVSQICDRWATDHTADLQQAFFNGDGFVSWENVWGIWNGLSARDSEATRRVGALLRFLTPFLTSPDWEPHVILNLPLDEAPSLFASRWPGAAGAPYPHNATAWTLVNKGAANASAAAPLVFVPCAGVAVYDLYAGAALTPAPVPAGGCAVPLGIEAGGFGAVLALDPADVTPALTAFLGEMRAMTAAALASYATGPVLLQQAMTVWQATPSAPAPPPGMIAVPGASAWTFAVDGTEIEGGSTPGTDVQFPWESMAFRHHGPTPVYVPALYVDTTPVTNGAYAAFLAASGYKPADGHNFLRDWAGAAAPPPGWESKPVTWVDLGDAAAFCTFYAKRLPNDWEWQYVAQGGGAYSTQYPWGDAWDATRVPAQTTGTARGPPPDVGGFPSGATPVGVLDMMGLVWQWTNEFTDDHTRAGLVRGGAYYRATGSTWYFPGDLSPSGDVRANTHNKLLLMAPSYDRHGTVGFRCVADAPGSPPRPSPPPPPATTGCADGTCDAFCETAGVRGCRATFTGNVSMRTPPTGKPCGGSLGPCASPADACGAGFAPCLSNFSNPALSLAGFRAALDAASCLMGGSGKFVAAMSHAELAWAPPGTCPATSTDDDIGCRTGPGAAGWGSEAVCCGNACVPAGCKSGVYVNATLIYDDQAHGCANVTSADADGVLCCRVAQ